MFQQNSILIKRRFFLLLIFLTSTLFASYHPIYDIENPQFEYTFENGNYKVYLLEEGSIDYNSVNGFELFLPNFLKEYNLGVLRFNSIGSIDGVLSTKKNEIESSKDIEFGEMKYYLTDYGTTNQRQLDYLFKNEKIPYLNKTSLAIQGYNIPSHIGKNLNKSIFFSFLNNVTDNKLTTLVYSYSMILDKKLVDNYVKRNKKLVIYEKDRTFNNLHTYLSSFTKVQKESPKKLKSETKERKITAKVDEQVEETSNQPKGLDLKRESEMKYFEDLSYKDSKERNKIGYVIEDNYEELEKSLNKLISLIEELKFSNETYATQLFNKKLENDKLLKELVRQKDFLISKMANVESNIGDNINDNNEGGKFNQLGIDYFKSGNIKEAEKYLLKAYQVIPKDDKEVVAYNLGVLYASLNSHLGHKKAIEYFKKSNLKEGYFNLGLYYYMGQVVKENNSIAYKYFSKSADLGFQRGENNRLKMENLYPKLSNK
jgi:hypothetical protein